MKCLKKIKMNKKITKIILIGVVLYGIYYLFSKYPDYGVLGIGIGLVIIIGIWLMELEKESINN